MEPPADPLVTVTGESVLNDAVAIVLYKTLTSFTHAEASAHALAVAFGSFLYIFFGSMLIGLLLGALSALADRTSHNRQRHAHAHARIHAHTRTCAHICGEAMQHASEAAKV